MGTNSKTSDVAAPLAGDTASLIQTLNQSLRLMQQLLQASPAFQDSSVTVFEVIVELLHARNRKWVSDAYLYQIRHCYDLLNRRFGRRQLASLTSHELEDWINSHDVGKRTRRGRIQYLRMLFEFARKREYLSRNPALAIDFPVEDPPEIHIHTPDQVRAVLAAALGQDVGLARALAVRYFAGLRSAEMVRLDEEEEIHLDRRLIEVTAIKSKTRRRRLVSISDNLAAWLALKGDIPGDLEKRITRVWHDAKVDWPRNVTRHSFCSYHLAQHQNAGKTALQAGHTEQILFSQYREVVTTAAAAEYWSIVPKT